MPVLADPSDLTRGVSDNQRIGFDLFDNNCSRSDKGIGSNVVPTDNCGIMEWPSELIHSLLEKVRLQEALWDVTNPHYVVEKVET